MANVADFTLRLRLDGVEENLREMRHSLDWSNQYGRQQSIDLVKAEIVKLEVKARFLKAQLKAGGVR